SQERGSNGGQAEEPLGGVPGPGGPGGDQGRPDRQRAGLALRGPPDPDPRLEEAAAGRGRGRVRLGGRGHWARGGQDGRAVRADRAAQGRARLGEKNLPPSAEAKRALVDPGHRGLSVRRQCELLDLSRSTLYYEPAPETPENLALMRRIDEQYTRCPLYGSRRITAWLRGEGHEVNRKRVQRLLRVLGLEAIHPKPKLSAGRGHKVYPYLLRG